MCIQFHSAIQDLVVNYHLKHYHMRYQKDRSVDHLTRSLGGLVIVTTVEQSSTISLWALCRPAVRICLYLFQEDEGTPATQTHLPSMFCVVGCTGWSHLLNHILPLDKETCWMILASDIQWYVTTANAEPLWRVIFSDEMETVSYWRKMKMLTFVEVNWQPTSWCSCDPLRRVFLQCVM